MKFGRCWNPGRSLKNKGYHVLFGKTFATQGYSYDFAIYKAIKAKKSTISKAKAKQEELKNTYSS